MSKMRIGIDARILAHPRSGIAAYLVGLVEELKLCPDLELVLFSDRAILPDYAEVVRGLETCVFAHDRRKDWANWHLAAPLKERSIGLYHAIWDAGIPFNAACPSILTLHSITPFCRPPFASQDMIRNPRKRLAYRLTFEFERRIARKLLVTSTYMKDYIHRLAGVPLDHMQVAYLGVDRMFTPMENKQRISEVLKKYGLDGGPFFLAVPSRVMEERKNTVGVIRGYDVFCQKCPGVRPPLVVVGEFLADRAISEKTLFAGLNPATRDAILFPGHVPREDLAVLLSVCVALVYPSIYEGFGLPLVEAMACGAPVLSAQSSCIPEVAGDAALLVDPFDTTAIGEGMLRLFLDASFRLHLRKAGFARVSAFSWKENARQTRDVYRQFYCREL